MSKGQQLLVGLLTDLALCFGQNCAVSAPVSCQYALFFDGQLRLARDFDLPVIVHARRAVDAVIRAHETLRRLPAKHTTGRRQPNVPVTPTRLPLMSMAYSTRWRLPPGDGRKPVRTLRN